MSAQGSAVLFERSEHIGIVTLNRPEAMNAVNAALATALGNLLDECSADPEIWAVVITGAEASAQAPISIGASSAGAREGRSVPAPRSGPGSRTELVLPVRHCT
jgi:enoyl-CoA hydratase/carnithine racemase